MPDDVCTNGKIGSPQKYVILTFMRSASNYLCGMLHNHPNIVCAYEIFVKKKRTHNSNGTLPLELRDIDKRDLDPLLFLRKFWLAYENQAAVGFKIFPWQSEQVLKHVIHDQSVKKIVLNRENKLKQFVSVCIAEQTSKWTMKKGETAQLASIAVDTNKLLDFISYNNRYYDSIRFDLIKSNQRFLNLEYKDLVSVHNHSTRNSVFEYLGVPVTTPDFLQLHKEKNKEKRKSIFDFLDVVDFDIEIPPNSKQNPFPLEQVIRNYDEVADVLTRAGYEEFLYR